MFYRLLADLVVIVHVVFILYALLGGLLGVWRKWALWLHVPAAVWIAAIEFQGWMCPLTPLENRLRAAGGAAGYEGGFVEHYVLPILYPAQLTRTTQLVLGVIAVGVNVAVYSFVFRRWRRRAG